MRWMPIWWLQQTSALNLYCSLARSIAHLGLDVVNNAKNGYHMDTFLIYC